MTTLGNERRRKDNMARGLFAVSTIGAVWFTVVWGREMGLLFPVFWVGTSFVWLAWLMLLGRGFIFRFRLPQRYYLIRGFERDPLFYRRLGVAFFKDLLLKVEGTVRVKRSRLSQTNADARAWENHSKTIEAAHTTHLLLLFPALLLSLASGRWTFALGIFVLLTGFDVYPIAMQRYNRSRLARLPQRNVAKTAPTGKATWY